MEKPVVSFIVNRLGVLLTDEAKLLYGVSNQVEEIRVELKRMQCFLEDADSIQDGDARVNNWVLEIRQLAYETEDILENYVIKVSSKRNRRGFRNTLKRFACIFNEWLAVHRVGCEIDAIKTKITNLTTSLQTYGLTNIGQGARSSIFEMQQELRRSYQHVVEEDFVGFEEDLKTVVKHLVQVNDDYTPSRVVSICGMGGLGKTTLAKKVYHHTDVQSHFDGFAWVCISQQFQTRDILQGMFIELVQEKKEDVVRMRNEELFKQLYEVQQRKKCLVVLDDIWSEEAWEILRPAFPNGKTGSKILLTTRNKELPSKIDPYHFFHEPRCLNEEESWELFQKKALLRRGGRDSRVLDTNMEALGRAMVKRCAGLPLAIIVLGGLLAAKHTFREWDIVYKKIMSNKWSDHPKQDDHEISKVLALSYHDLPYQLKPCFLYFGHFPEDYRIDAKKLYNLWIAEDILSADDRVGDETLMDVAERYLGVLAQRCMVQVEVEEYTGRIKCCRMHDLMLDLSLSKAQMNDFLGIIHLQCKTDLADCFSTTSTTPATFKTRKLAIHLNRDVEKVVLPNLETTQQPRSILLFDQGREVGASLESNSHFKCYKLLRVLDLEGFVFDEKSLGLIGNLISLRHLSFRNCHLQKWHSSICKLKYLRTLDLRCSFGFNEVIVLDGMERLRHLYLYCCQNWKFKLDGLSKLETLDGFDTKSCDVNDLCKLINLRQLENATFSFIDIHGLAALVNYLNISASHLRQTFLSVEFSFKEDLIILEQLVGCHHLCTLRITGLTGFPPELSEYQSFSPNLTNLKLRRCLIKEDPMPTLERIPNLQFLEIDSAFMVRKMVCSANGFPQLRTLNLCSLFSLTKWEVEKGAMPCLSRLFIMYCRQLKTVPEGLRFIATLQQFTTAQMSDEFNKKVRYEDFYKVRDMCLPFPPGMIKFLSFG